MFPFHYFSYEKSDTHRFEVPRMLFDDPVVLEQYVKKKKDRYHGIVVLIGHTLYMLW